MTRNVCMRTWNRTLFVLPFNGGEAEWVFDGSFYWKRRWLA